ncbi:metallophosphoesterase [Akkermansiaceae bacterium]|jgi:predicted MPP superfamily phosphohydrolase|nr:metallophosphoesterase [Akkermansiaceae bacterium]
MTRRSVIGLAGIGVPSAIWASGIEPNLLSITRKNLVLPRWPKSLDGFRIAQITDVHYRPGTDEELIAKLRKALEAEEPDCIAITGDFVINDPSSLAEFARALRGISAAHGIFASPGNHDRWHCTVSNIKKEFESIGISYLQNKGTNINIKGERIFINGLDSVWGGRPVPNRAWNGHQKNTPVISMVHEPDFFDELHTTKLLDLQLSGHTHGGQCRLPLINYTPAKVKFGRNYIYGHFKNDRSQLFVGRGIGTVGLRVRFACRPELVILTLRST